MSYLIKDNQRVEKIEGEVIEKERERERVGNEAHCHSRQRFFPSQHHKHLTNRDFRKLL